LIADNTVYSDYARGGGIGTEVGDTTIVNSTIAQNQSLSGPHKGDVGAFGGGIHHHGGKLILMHDTVAKNQASGTHYGAGGGMAVVSADLLMSNTIVADNTATTTNNNFSGDLGTSSYNLIDVDPMLGSLQDNGGPTWTMALQPGSPATDAGDPNPVDPPDWDQRGPGFPRIVNGRLDIGAFEVQTSAAPSTPNQLALLITADFEPKDSN
jgi:hypothetical protein